MSRTFTGAVLALVVAAVGAGSAQADGWCYPWYTATYYYPTYYYVAPAPVYYVVQPVAQVYPAAMVRPATPVMPYGQPMPAPTPVMPYAQPVPAPASSNPEPPLAKPTVTPPTVTESKSLSPGEASAPAGGEGPCRVGFWNVSGRDVKLTVNGKSYTVARDRNLTLTLGRAISWQIDGRTPELATVPPEQLSHEIVIR